MCQSLCFFLFVWGFFCLSDRSDVKFYNFKLYQCFTYFLTRFSDSFPDSYLSSLLSVDCKTAFLGAALLSLETVAILRITFINSRFNCTGLRKVFSGCMVELAQYAKGKEICFLAVKC